MSMKSSITIERRGLEATIFAPPVIRPEPVGTPVTLDELCRDAGIKMRVTVGEDGGSPVFIQRSGMNIKAVARGGARPLICVDVSGYPEDRAKRARRVLECMAYGFRDWAARELLRQDGNIRRLERSVAERLADPDAQAALRRKAATPRNLEVLESIRAFPEHGATFHAQRLGMALPNVSRAIRMLERAGWVEIVHAGRQSFSRPTMACPGTQPDQQEMQP
jgi:DNA-binding transcriptional ArsR family regulator